MALSLHKEFEVDAAPRRVWEFLVDPANVALCLPGARLLEIVDERTFLGEVSFHLGPFGVVFRGRARYTALDPGMLTARLLAEATESRGRASGELEMQSRLTTLAPGRTGVWIEQNFRLEGRLGGVLGAGLVREAAVFVLARFAACVRARIEAAGPTSAAEEAGSR
jgi:hypothetical protein